MPDAKGALKLAIPPGGAVLFKMTLLAASRKITKPTISCRLIAYWRVVRSCRFLQSEDSGVTAADKADFGGEEFLERKAFG